MNFIVNGKKDVKKNVNSSYKPINLFMALKRN